MKSDLYKADRTILWRKIALLVLCVLAAGCATAPHKESKIFDSRFQRDPDNRPIPMPVEREPGRHWDRTHNILVRQIYRAIYIPGWVSALAEKLDMKGPKEPENINAWDEVPDSSWFTNRIGTGKMNLEEIRRGPRRSDGPDTSGHWDIMKGKISGVTPGFVIKDSSGDVYFLKFDPPGYEGISSGAEIVSTLVHYAVGYNVPENYIVRVPLSIFRLGEKATTKGKYGVKRLMTQKDIDDMLARTGTDREEKIRVLASKGIPGRPIGGFYFQGRRPDDPNDRIPHEHRRELRGLRLFSAWLNNTDVQIHNTLDMYQGEPGEGHLRHYLLDFGTSLGSAGNRPKRPVAGHEYFVDFEAIGKSFITLGSIEPEWVWNEQSGYLSVGIFESDNFDPLKWKNAYPVRAFELMNDWDAFWAAKIIMAFSDEMIEAIVKEAQYHEKGAAEYVLKTLIKRRDKIGRECFNRVTPLDDFEVSGGKLIFRDLAMDYGLTEGSQRKYLATLWRESRNGRKLLLDERHKTGGQFASLPIFTGKPGNNFFTFRIEVEDLNIPVGKGVDVTLYCRENRACRVTGVKRR
ncbi:MAG: hypothetical protein GY774_34690 [Planctomycetes bacterium]|nr:hypothetical protein [Planctomycetota bacterium]